MRRQVVVGKAREELRIVAEEVVASVARRIVGPEAAHKRLAAPLEGVGHILLVVGLPVTVDIRPVEVLERR